MTWGAGGLPSDYCGGHVSVPRCLLGWLRDCLKVVTGIGENDCCVTGCPCHCGVAVPHCFFVALSGDSGQCEMCTCHLQQ